MSTLPANEPPAGEHRTDAAVVVIAHGSRSAEANDAHRETCRALAERTGRRVEAAFLELAEPGLVPAVTALATDGISSIVVVPFFLYPGRHMQRDIPALVTAANEAHPDLDIALAPLFGADPGVVDLLAAAVQRTPNAVQRTPNAAEDR